MADAQSILSYQGNPDLAIGSSAGTGINTSIVDSSPAVKYWMQYAQNKYESDAQKLADLNKERLSNATKLQSALDIGNYKFWDADKEAFKGQWDQFVKQVQQNPSSVYDPNNPDFYKTQTAMNNLQQFAKFSNQQYEDWKTAQTFYNSHPEVLGDDGLKQLEDYRSVADPIKRANSPLQFTPSVSANALDFVAKLKSSITPTQQVTSQQDKYGRYVDTTVSIYDAKDINSAVAAQYQTDKKFQKGWDDAFNNLPPAEQDKFGSTVGYASSLAFDALNGGSKQTVKNPFYPPAYTQKPPEGSDQPYVNEMINHIQNKDADVLRSLSSGTLDGHLISKAQYVNSDDILKKATKERDALYKQRDAAKDQSEKDRLQNKIDEKSDLIAKTKDQPTTIQIDFSDGQRSLTIPIPPASEGQEGGAYYPLNTVIRKLEKENNVRFQDVLGDISNKPLPNQKTNTQKTPSALSGKIDPKTLVVNQAYTVNGKTYVWDGKKLIPQ